MNLFDDDDYMVSTPKDNFFSIIKSANQNIVEMEVTKIFERLAVAEKLLEDNGLDKKYEQMVNTFAISDPQEYDERLNSLFIETVGNIVTQCE